MKLASLGLGLAFALATVLLPSAAAQVTVSALNTAYTQNFDSLTTAGAWSDNTTLAGWYARTTATATIATLGLNTGSTTTGGFYSFGSTSASDRALGYAASNAFSGSSGSGQNLIGLRLTNLIGLTVTSFSVAYDAEQWRKENNAAAHSLTVQWALGATGVNDSSVSWTNLSALTFTSPIFGATTAAVLDGNATANRQSLTTTASATWLSGTDLWLRWVDLNDSGNDHLMAIDNVSFSAVSAIPEPATYASLVGLLALVGAATRRKKSA